MTNKTAVQSFLDLVNGMPGDALNIDYLKNKLAEMLEEEKKQIIQAFTAGQIDIGTMVCETLKVDITKIKISEDIEDGEDYYQSTYQNTKP